MVYRDLKLDNTLIDNNLDLKICDFGLSIDLDTLRDPKIPNLRSGSNTYMAPEVARFSKVQDEKIDIFSLGVALFVMYF